MARLSAKVDPNSNRSGTTRGDPRNIRQSLTGAAAAQWQSRVIACIRPHISIEVSPNMKRGQYVAQYRVKLLPTGEQMGAPVLERASGWKAYDQAVERAIRRCNPFPKPDGRHEMPREVELSFDPVDDRQK